jgi:cytochrome P450
MTIVVKKGVSSSLVRVLIESSDRSVFELLRDVRRDLTGLYKDCRFYSEPRIVRHLVSRKIVSVMEPELIEHILLKNHANYRRGQLQKNTVQPWAGEGILASEGAVWRRQRKLSEPWFFRHRLNRFATPIVSAARQCADTIGAHAAPDGAFDAEAAMMGFSTRVIAGSLFSADIEAQFDALRDALGAVQKKMARVGLLDLLGVGHHARRLVDWRARRLNRALRAIFGPIIEERMAGRVHRDDFLQTMVDARGGEDGERLSEAQIYDTAISYFLGAPESVGYSLVWTLYLLAHHPDVQDRLAAEVAALDLAAVDMAALDRLEECWAALQEAMRLYPPVHSFTREALGPDQFGDLKIARGDLFFFPVYAIHRHRALWEAPDEFRPARFHKSARTPIDHLRFLAFSAGPRYCLGRSLAEMETKIALAVLLRRFRFEPDPSYPVAGVEAYVTMRPRGGCRLRALPR